MTQHHIDRRDIVGGVDTHKDLHMAAVVDTHDRVLGTASFPTTRHGYKPMLAWMRSFGEISRVVIECAGTYGAGLLRYLQRAGITVLEVTTPDKTVRRKRGKNDTIDAAYAGVPMWCQPDTRFSAKTQRHRLNRGGDRAANSALHIIAIGRLLLDATTQAYVSRRVTERHSKLEAIRCLKRYIAREVYYVLRHDHQEDQPGDNRHLTLRRASH